MIDARAQVMARSSAVARPALEPPVSGRSVKFGASQSILSAFLKVPPFVDREEREESRRIGHDRLCRYARDQVAERLDISCIDAQL